MTEPQAPVVPEGAPQEVKDFLECRGDVMRWQPGTATWLGLPIDPDVSFDHGATVGSININVTVGSPPFDVSFSLPASVNAEGELTVDSSSIPDAFPGKESLEGSVRNINEWFKQNGKKLKSATLWDGVVTLEKMPLTTAGPPPVVAAITPVVPAATEPPTRPPVGAEPVPPSTGGGYCSLLGIFLILVMLLGVGVGFGVVYLGGQPPASSPVAGATGAPTQPPTAAPTLGPSVSPTATSSATQAPSTPPPASASPAASVSISKVDWFAGAYGGSCIRVRHTAWGDFVSYLDWLMDLAEYAGLDPVENIDYVLITVADTNGGEPVQLAYEPGSSFWGGRFGLSAAGSKAIISVEVHWTDGSVTDVTDLVVADVGVIDVPYPQEPDLGACKNAPSEALSP